MDDPHQADGTFQFARPMRWLAGGALAAALCGCGGTTHQSARTLSLADFASSEAPSVSPPPPDDGGSLAPTDPAEAPDGEPTTTGAVPPAAAPGPRPLQPGKEVVVDGLIGQINGRPIFANDFFGPLDAQLRAESAKTTLLQFDAVATNLIRSRMLQILQNELLIAQAESRLTPEEQQGLFYWLTKREEGLIAEQGTGSREEAASRLLAEEGISLEGRLREDREAALIRLVIEREIQPRVIVSWRDVERAYARNYDVFNKPGEMRLSTIILNPDRDAERIESVTARLAAGEPFTDVAASINGRENGDFYGPLAISPGGLSALANENLWPEMIETIRGMEVGDKRGPITISPPGGGSRVAWIKVLSLSYPPGRSLYEPAVQTTLWDTLRAQQFGLEQQNYFDELLNENILAEIDDIGKRLLALAIERYR
jgi:hypothetical protein